MSWYVFSSSAFFLSSRAEFSLRSLSRSAIGWVSHRIRDCPQPTVADFLPLRVSQFQSHREASSSRGALQLIAICLLYAVRTFGHGSGNQMHFHDLLKRSTRTPSREADEAGVSDHERARPSSSLLAPWALSAAHPEVEPREGAPVSRDEIC